MNNNYFPHDYYARNDPKMIKLRRIMKFEGVGIFWSLLEILWENEGFILESDIENIAYEMQTQCERIKNVLHNFDLFKFENGKYFSESQQFRMKLKLEKSKKASESATVRWNKAKAMQTQCDGNTIKEVKEVNESNKNIDTKPERKTFIIPTIEEIKSYLLEKNINSFTAEKFYNFYDSKGWMVGKNKMKNWKSAVNTWIENNDGKKEPMCEVQSIQTGATKTITKKEALGNPALYHILRDC